MKDSFFALLHSVFGEFDHNLIDRQVDWATAGREQPCLGEDMAIVPVANSLGAGRCKFCRVENGIYYAHVDLTLDHRFRSYSVGTHMMRLRVCLSGRSWQPSHAVLSRGVGPHCAIVAIPPGTEMDVEWDGGVRQNSLLLYVAPSLLQEFIGPDPVGGCLSEIRASGEGDAKTWLVPLSYDLMKVCGELVNAPYNGSLLKVYQSAKARELICMLLSEFADVEDGEAPFRLSSRDIELIHAARQLIIDTRSQPFSIAELARRVGINRNKLMRNFKLTFGETIWSFQTRLRMDHARALLVAGDRTILQVSECLGYRHQASFTTAFKKHFGHCPRSLRA